MTKVTIVGEMYYSELGVGGGPIVPPGSPPGIWGGAPPYVDIGGPGPQPGPSHPWVPPRPGQPPGIWGGANEPFPTPPIFIGPVLPPDTPTPDPVEWHSAWSAQTGWMTVGIPTGEAPTPSSGE
jgi:hypothetical protein